MCLQKGHATGTPIRNLMTTRYRSSHVHVQCNPNLALSVDSRLPRAAFTLLCTKKMVYLARISFESPRQELSIDTYVRRG